MQDDKSQDVNISLILDETLLPLSFKLDRIELLISKLNMTNGTNGCKQPEAELMLKSVLSGY